MSAVDHRDPRTDRFTALATSPTWRPFIDAEVRQTVELYLNGKIEPWWVPPDQTSVSSSSRRTIRNVQAMLDRLPPGRAGLTAFELIQLGPLSPLRLLLRQPAPQDNATP